MKKSRMVAIIQARMGSTRFPEKVMAKIMGKTMLERIIERIQAARRIDKIIIATSTNKENDRIAIIGRKNKIDVYRGSEEDVVDRIYKAAKQAKADVIVRITADDPLVDPELMDRMVGERKRRQLDFLGNSNPETFPHGLNLDVMRMEALERLWELTRNPKYHDTFREGMFENPAKFRIGNYEHENNLSHLRWTVDTREDLEFMRGVYKHLYTKKRIFLMKDILEFLEVKLRE